MKKLFVLVFLMFPSFVFAIDTYNAQTGELYMPNVSVDGTPYDVTMQHQGNLVFQVTTAEPVSFPEQFSVEWLQGKTLYNVYHGFAEDASGNTIDDASGIIMLVFNSDNTAQAQALQNRNTSGQATYNVNVNGGLYFNNDSFETSTIIAHTSTCLVTRNENSFDPDMNNTDFFCFTAQDAQDLADSLEYERIDDW